MPHERCIYTKAYDIAKATMCSNPQSDYSLPHWKCILQCCAKFPIINIHDQKKNDQYPDTSPFIRFHSYHLTLNCTKHDRIQLTHKKSFCKCQQDTASGQSTKI